jgi:hypothetical protein
LRVLAPSPFSLRWSADGGQTSRESASTQSFLDLHYVDIPTQFKEPRTLEFSFTVPQITELHATTHQVKVKLPTVGN